jgi:hypothetical protein
MISLKTVGQPLRDKGVLILVSDSATDTYGYRLFPTKITKLSKVGKKGLGHHAVKDSKIGYTESKS